MAVGFGGSKDIPAFGAPIELVWLVRRYRCAEDRCPDGVFIQETVELAAARANLTTRAGW